MNHIESANDCEVSRAIRIESELTDDPGPHGEFHLSCSTVLGWSEKPGHLNAVTAFARPKARAETLAGPWRHIFIAPNFNTYTLYTSLEFIVKFAQQDWQRMDALKCN